MLKGFKDFILRGNVIELAVAVVIGGAFNRVVEAFVKNVMNPLLAALPGASVEGLGFRLVKDKPATFIDLAAVINTIIAFLLTATVVYFLIVMPMNKIEERRKRRLGITEADETPEDVVLLREIRDALTARGTVTPGHTTLPQEPRL